MARKSPRPRRSGRVAISTAAARAPRVARSSAPAQATPLTLGAMTALSAAKKAIAEGQEAARQSTAAQRSEGMLSPRKQTHLGALKEDDDDPLTPLPSPVKRSVATIDTTAAPASPGSPSRRSGGKRGKVFLLSGLYSSDFKRVDDDGSGQASKIWASRAREARKAAKEAKGSPDTRGMKRTRSKANMERDRPQALPLPLHYGEYLLTRRADFALPEYLLEEEEAIRLKLDSKAKPPPYGEISKNKYVSRQKLSADAAICQCSPDSNCGDDCMNRLMQYLCDPKTCPTGAKCTNTRLGSRPVPKCEVIKCGKRGFGLRAKEFIKRGTLVDEYRGEVIDLQEATRRTIEIYKTSGNFYLLDYDAAAGEVLDSGMRGNRTRFANHSCEPNCHMEKWILCGTGEQLMAEFEVGLFASRDIQPGEEVCYDYGWSMFVGRSLDGAITHEGTPIQCHCGSKNCAGFLGGKKQKAPPPKVDKKTKKGKKKRSSRSKVTDDLTAEAAKKVEQDLKKAVRVVTKAAAQGVVVPKTKLDIALQAKIAANEKENVVARAMRSVQNVVTAIRSASLSPRKSLDEREVIEVLDSDEEVVEQMASPRKRAKTDAIETQKQRGESSSPTKSDGGGRPRGRPRKNPDVPLTDKEIRRRAVAAERKRVYRSARREGSEGLVDKQTEEVNKPPKKSQKVANAEKRPVGRPRKDSSMTSGGKQSGSKAKASSPTKKTPRARDESQGPPDTPSPSRYAKPMLSAGKVTLTTPSPVKQRRGRASDSAAAAKKASSMKAKPRQSAPAALSPKRVFRIAQEAAANSETVVEDSSDSSRQNSIISSFAGGETASSRTSPSETSDANARPTRNVRAAVTNTIPRKLALVKA